MKKNSDLQCSLFKHLGAILLICFAIGPGAVAQAGKTKDHLEPEENVFLGDTAYEEIVANSLLRNRPGSTQAQMLVLPSFQSEWAVYILHLTDGTRIVSVKTKAQIWGALQPDMSKVPIGTSVEIGGDSFRARAKRLKFEIDRKEAMIDDALCERIEKIWELMLMETRYPIEGSYGYDGVTFHFSTFVRGKGNLSGQIWSPQTGKTKKMTDVGIAMYEYSISIPVKRQAARNALLNAVDEMETMLKIKTATKRDHH